MSNGEQSWRIAIVGEAMIELSETPLGEPQLGFAGDTLNTAIGLARLGVATAYATALGTDPYSARMRSAWQGEGLDCRMVLTAPAALPGLYAIQTDADGERRFFYWRRDSAARHFFDLPGSDEALAALSASPWLYLSGITLAIFEDQRREALLALLQSVKARGGKIAFDPNYRPALWPDRAVAQAAMAQVVALADMLLPTFEDEQALHADVAPEQTLARLAASPAREVVVKLGAAGCMLGDGSVIAPPARLQPVDTSGAGDAFNAGYLAARLGGAAPAKAARCGHRLAGITLMHRGAIAPRAAIQPLEILA